MPHESEDVQFEQLLDYLRQTRGFDFTAYKRTTLRRRIQKRMQVVDVDSFEAYLDYLQLHQDEFASLFDTILINVTSFFRDVDVWEYMGAEVFPALLQARADSVLRVWSAGSASGQEAYTVAMLLAEHVGAEALRDRAKIYATDADENALATARLGQFDARQVEAIPPPLLQKYFERSGDHYAVSRELRRAVIFGRHDLVQDAPISRVDLLICRNTLMYFHTEAQARILARLYFALNPGGLVLLGRAEMLFSHSAMFVPVDLKRRLFRGIVRPSHRDRLILLAQTGRDIMAHEPQGGVHLREAAFETDAVPQLIVDATGGLAAVNAAARSRFGLAANDVGRPFRDLEISYRPAELRSQLEVVQDERRDVVVQGVQWQVGSELRYLDVLLSPLYDDQRSLVGARISFLDVTQQKALELELQHSKQELETAYEELQSTNEELETTNEELQSTVEELETTNEELQSTNEELETMNEELQSTNEELQTINDELRNRSTDLNAANAFMESVLASLRSAVVVLDREFRVLVWNDQAADMWGLRADETQLASFFSLDIGLPLADLRGPIREVLAGKGSTETVLQATNRRGRAFQCRVATSPLRQFDRTAGGVILLMDEEPSQTGAD